MSSRVQKGGTVFKPVVKPRPRASATPVPNNRPQASSSSAPPVPAPAVASHDVFAATTVPPVSAEGSTTVPAVRRVPVLIGRPSRTTHASNGPTVPAPNTSLPPARDETSSSSQHILSVAPVLHSTVPLPAQPPVDHMHAQNAPPTFETPVGLSQISPEAPSSLPLRGTSPLAEPEIDPTRQSPPPEAPQPSAETSPPQSIGLVVPTGLPSGDPYPMHVVPFEAPNSTPAPTAEAPLAVEGGTQRPPAGEISGSGGLDPAHDQDPGNDRGPIASTEVSQPRKPRPKRRTRKKGETTDGETTEAGDATEIQRPKRQRRPRKASATQPTDEPLPDENTAADGETTEAAESSKPKRKRRTRKASSAQPTEEEAQRDENGEIVIPAPKRRRRASASKSKDTPAPRSGRPKKTPLPAFDVDADPGEEPDPTVLTMANLIEDSGQGRVSSKAADILSNHAAWKATSKAKRAAMKARLETKKYGREEDDEMVVVKKAEGTDTEQEAASTSQLVKERSQPPVATFGSDRIEDDDSDNGGKDDGFDYRQNVQTSRFAVQVRIGPNGETIVDDQSLFVDRNDEEDETAGYTHIEESDLTKFVNSMSHSKKTNGSRWSAEETELFYDALRQFGENYELISLVMPGRDRKACRNKFKAEDKRNTNRINWCLNNRLEYDISTLSRLTGKDFSGPTPVIRMPTPLTLTEDKTSKEKALSSGPKDGAASTAKVKRKTSKTPSVLPPDEEIMGAADTFVDEDD